LPGPLSDQPGEFFDLPHQLVKTSGNLRGIIEVSLVKPAKGNKGRADDLQHEQATVAVGQADPLGIVEDQVQLPRGSKHVRRSRMIEV
jgi:hypothetical protein